MAVERPTFHESWYRVGPLRPRLRTTVQTYRQHFRARRWHVVQDPSNNQYFRISDAAYHFVTLLDGRRTVQGAWTICQELFGDYAPTQGEAINLLGQLHASNLLQSDLPPDAANMFENHRRRVRRQVVGTLKNLLFVRIPVFDPDFLLERWEWILGVVFTRIGFAVWLVLLAVGGYALIGRAGEFAGGVAGVLAPDNLFLLYLAFAGVKALHELGHGIATKRLGRISGSGGEVHTIGITLLVFTPVPYVDASSARALRSKWHRALVGAAGMYVELAVAAVAAIVWASTSPGLVHALAYNVILVAGVATLVFNGNPLLRFDGYYILSDLFEAPNLAQRSRDFLYYLVRRFGYGLTHTAPPVVGPGEPLWLTLYGVGSSAYRVVIVVTIVLFLSEKLFLLGALVGATTVVSMVIVPLGRLFRYLVTDPSLARGRPRAIGATAVIALATLAGLGLVPVPDAGRAEGVVEPVEAARVYADVDGFVETVLPSGQDVAPDRAPLLVARNLELESAYRRLLAERLLVELERERAGVREHALAQILTGRIGAMDDQLDEIERQRRSLRVTAPFAGRWIAPDVERLRGAYLRRGDEIGLVATVDRLLVRAVADQRVGPRLEPELGRGGRVEIRVKGRPELTFTGRIGEILPAGSTRLPSAALGYQAGGSTLVESDDESGTVAAEPFFQTLIELDPGDPSAVGLWSGQRVVVRFEMPARPLIVQWWRELRQLIQRRFEV